MRTETLLNAYAIVVYNLPGDHNHNSKRHRQAAAFRAAILARDEEQREQIEIKEGLIIVAELALEKQRKKIAEMESALEKIANFPVVVEGDHPFDVISWAASTAEQALGREP